MATKYDSLLSQPGVSFGELAGAYLSSGRKKDNRARNLLLGTLFFNAAEASRQAKVADKLRRQEIEDKMLESKLAAQFETQMNLINKDQDIKKQGKYVFFDADAERAFEAALEDGKLEPLFGPEGGLENGNRIKRKWKQEWIDNNPYADHTSQMTNIDVKTAPRTLEAFSKEAKDYMYAVNKNITKPQDVSLVHKAFNAIGIGKSDKEYNDEVIRTKKELDEKQQKINSFYKYDIGENIKNKVALNVEEEKLTIPYIRKQFQDAFGTNDALLESKFIKDVVESGQTMTDVDIYLSSYAISRNKQSFDAANERAQEKVYSYYGVSDEKGMQTLINNGKVPLELYQSTLLEERLKSLGMTDKISSNVALARGWAATIAQAQKLDPKQQEVLIQNYFKQIEDEQFISPTEEGINEAAKAVYQLELSNILKDRAAYDAGDELMRGLIFSQELSDADIAEMSDALRDAGATGLNILNQLQEVNFTISRELPQDSLAYKFLEARLADAYFSKRSAHASALMKNFNVSANKYFSVDRLLKGVKKSNNILNIPTEQFDFTNAANLAD